jgi:hypothetical protein
MAATIASGIASPSKASHVRPAENDLVASTKGSRLRSSYGRHNRWNYLGLVNEPCFKEPTGPDPNRYGLWLDVRDASCPPDPFADEKKYPGVKIDARGTTVGVGSFYGEPSGIVGLRLFPNPDFDENARKRWNSERYYTDPKYYEDRHLVRPYRVGMSCAFCHVGPNPIRPPADPENPRWENLSSNVGAQYFWVDRIFNWRAEANAGSFFYQLFHTSRPGSLDTSIVSTDNINNPRTMNAVYYLGPRMGLAKKWGKETLGGGGLKNKQFNDYLPNTDPLAQFFVWPSTTWTPRVLKDGADSVGALGALNRVYINIGLFSEEWVLHFRPIIGGQKISPIEIEVAEKNSSYWRATEMQTPNMARFFLASTEPHHLKDAPNGSSFLTEDAATLQRGKVVFAERCARCHSSKIPPLPASLDLENANGAGYLAKWNEYWALTKTEEFKSQMRPIVLADDFLKDNYLSTELRVPAPLMGINACSPGHECDQDTSGTISPPTHTSSCHRPGDQCGTRSLAESDLKLLPEGAAMSARLARQRVVDRAVSPGNSVGHFEASPSVEARCGRSGFNRVDALAGKRDKDPLFANENGPASV